MSYNTNSISVHLPLNCFENKNMEQTVFVHRLAEEEESTTIWNTKEQIKGCNANQIRLKIVSLLDCKANEEVSIHKYQQ